MTHELPTVVIVEDTGAWFRMLPRFLEGYSIVVLQTLTEALNFLSEQEVLGKDAVHIAAFIVDGNLSEDTNSGEDGQTVIKRIRAIQQYDSVPIIGNSGNKELAGADYKLNKDPEKIDHLPAWVRSKRE